MLAQSAIRSRILHVNYTKHLFRKCVSRNNSSVKVLGIETSCDDTGIAIVDSDGTVLGEAIHSQTSVHVQAGGIYPLVARDLHRQHIQDVVKSCLSDANMDVSDVDAIACTSRPGLVWSLLVGLDYAKELVQKYQKPFIPIHHMKAHALTARMMTDVQFPFLVLLVSGGHSLLTVAKSVDEFLLIGKGLDDSPGEAFDKTARELQLKNHPQCTGLSGGAAIELLAKQGGNPQAFPLVHVMAKTPNCNFSFAGIKESYRKLIHNECDKLGIHHPHLLPNVGDICASFQYTVLQHMCKRVQRALLYCELRGLLPETHKTLVLSGGVASNLFIRKGLQKICELYNCQLICPPPKLCTDNGIMVAWNGVELLRHGVGISSDVESIDAEPKCPIGQDITGDVENCAIKLNRINLFKLLQE